MFLLTWKTISTPSRRMAYRLPVARPPMATWARVARCRPAGTRRDRLLDGTERHHLDRMIAVELDETHGIDALADLGTEGHGWQDAGFEALHAFERGHKAGACQRLAVL